MYKHTSCCLLRSTSESGEGGRRGGERGGLGRLAGLGGILGGLACLTAGSLLSAAVDLLHWQQQPTEGMYEH